MEFSVNMYGVKRILDSLHAQGKAAGLTIQHLAWECMADACNDILKLSPPRTQSGGSWPQQKALGEGSVESDLKALFQPDDLRTGKIMVFQNQHNSGWYYRPVDRKLADWVSAVPPSRVAGGDIKAIHHKYRKPNGRVVKHPPIHLARPAFINAYVRTIKGHVGKLKSGWCAAADYFCGKVGKQKWAPDWVVRHSEPSKIEDGVSVDGNGKMVAANLAPTAGAIRRDALRYVMRKRQGVLDGMLAKRVEKIAARIDAASMADGAVTA